MSQSPLSGGRVTIGIEQEEEELNLNILSSDTTRQPKTLNFIP